jgi:hypothetical protein
MKNLEKEVKVKKKGEICEFIGYFVKLKLFEKTNI